MLFPRLLVLARPGEVRTALERAVAEACALPAAAATVPDALGALARVPHSGIVFEAATLVRQPAAHREVVRALGNVFPAARARLDLPSGALQFSHFGREPDECMPLAEFIERECRPFPARRLRGTRRTRRTIPLLVCPGRAFDPQSARRAVTLDVSEGGCFVITMDDIREAHRVSLLVPELADPTPILAEVRWSQTWGRRDFLPGAGLRFEGLSDLQRVRLRSLARS